MTEKEVVDIESLNENERKKFDLAKMKMFKMTILTCVFFSIIAGTLLFTMMFTQWGKENIYDKMSYFVFTFTIGTLFVISILLYNIYSFEPTKTKQGLEYDSEICPDYWDLVKEDQEVIENIDLNGLNTNHFKYKCKLNTDIVSKNKMVSKFSDPSTTPLKLGAKESSTVLMSNKNIQNIEGIEDENKQYLNVMSHINRQEFDEDELIANSSATQDCSDDYLSNINNTYPIICDQVYPMFLSSIDQKNKKDDPNAKSLRCAYAKQCNIPWTEAGCI